MDQTNTLAMLAAISEANGVSGFEDEAVQVLRYYSEHLGDSREDRMRNLMLYRKENTGDRPAVLLDAHSDEVGFMVQAINKNGTLRFITLGGWVPATIPAHRVWVRTKTGGYIPGIIASKPPHFMKAGESGGVPSIEDMCIDVGARSRVEAETVFGVRIGEPVVPDASFEWVEANGSMIGKAFDCRIGCSALLSTLDELSGEALPLDLVASFSVQEELGVRGAKVVANQVQPDVAILFEGCPADDTFPAGAIQCAMGEGPMLRHVDSSMVTNPRFLRFALDVAKKEDIQVQEAVRTGGGTNGGAYHLANEGIPVIVIGLPVRYIHTHYGIARWDDYEAAVRLAKAILRKLDAGLIASF